jgi:hypothetical protein
LSAAKPIGKTHRLHSQDDGFRLRLNPSYMLSALMRMMDRRITPGDDRGDD